MTVWIAMSSMIEHEWEIDGVYDTEDKAYDALSGVYGAHNVQAYEVE